MRWWIVFLAGCPYVGDEVFDQQVEDVDGDGAIAVRFDGTDCRDNDATVVSCDEDADGYLAAAYGGDDCNDADPTVHPEATEVCDGVDNDCDELIDDQDMVPDEQLGAWFADADADGFGGGSAVRACAGPPGFVDNALDCNDGRADVNPNALERCDPVDHNCDGDFEGNATDAVQWYSAAGPG